MDVRSKEQVVKRLKAPVASKQFGQEEILSSLVADVIINCIPSIVFVSNCLYDSYSAVYKKEIEKHGRVCHSL